MREFNSQICTSREQSDRLLALGLKPETADMCLDIERNVATSELPRAFTKKNSHRVIPAWSLHRLIEMLNIQMQTDGRYIYLADGGFDAHASIYDNIIDCIEWLIKEGYFNKEYLG